MFTGIVEYVGTIESLERSDSGARIRVIAGPLAAGLAKSGSIAVNGCCLTAVEISDGSFAADLSSETLRRTSFGGIKPGTRVNLERPLTAMKELGGLAMKGSIALDGISLTVASWHDCIVESAIIPFTYKHTNLSSLKVGDAVNVECDVLAKYVERLMEARQETAASRLTVARLTEEGF